MGVPLPRALSSPDSSAAVATATIVGINADGTVVVDFGAARRSGKCLVLAGYTPLFGDVVQVLARDGSSWLVLGSVRTSNATTQNLVVSCRTPRNIVPSTSGVPNPFVVSAAATGSWRDADGWSQSAPYQGAYSPSRGYYRGCYFYGPGAFAALAGRTVTSVQIRLHRHTAIGGGGVGSSGPIGQYIAPHPHPAQPGEPPYLPVGAYLAGTLTAPDDNQAGWFSLPVSWGQALADGQFAGFAHVQLTAADYQRCKSVAEDGASGQLSIGWA